MTRHDAQQLDANDRGDISRGSSATHDQRGSATPALLHLSDMDDCEIADGEPDIRGWDIKTMDGRKIGEVDDLLVDTQQMKVRYMEVSLDDEFGTDEHHRQAVLPIGSARLDDDEDEVVVNMRAEDLRGLPPYTRNAFSRDDERTLMERLAGRNNGAADASLSASAHNDDFYGQPSFDDQRLFEGRRAKHGSRADNGSNYITRSEEELSIGKRQVRAGEVAVEKHVETEHVRESVPVMREEVTVERRPVSGDHALNAQAQVETDEIRIPIMHEEAVVDKRAVVKEEIVIKKQAKQGEQIVEADLRKERVDVDRSGTGEDKASGTRSSTRGRRKR